MSGAPPGVTTEKWGVLPPTSRTHLVPYHLLFPVSAFGTTHARATRTLKPTDIERSVPSQEPFPCRAPKVVHGPEVDLREGPHRRVLRAVVVRVAVVPHEPAYERAVPDQLERGRGVLEKLLLQVERPVHIEDVKVLQGLKVLKLER